jgi:hypothetical protein
MDLGGFSIFFTLLHGSRKRLGAHTVGRPIIIFLERKTLKNTQPHKMGFSQLIFYLFLFCEQSRKREIEDDPSSPISCSSSKE